MKSLKIIDPLNYFFMIAFLLSVIVQYNDADGIIWMLMYGLAALAAVLYKWGKISWLYPAFVGLIALVWAIGLLPDVINSSVSIAESFENWEMIAPGSEESREMFGLLIIVVWMIILSIASKRKIKSLKAQLYE